MDRLERVARAICITHGRDPDFEIYGLKDWEVWKDHAQAAIDAMQQWQLIDNAPHDTEVLLYCPIRHESNPERIEVGKATRGVRNYSSGWSTYSAHAWATHWMPLPEFPIPEE